MRWQETLVATFFSPLGSESCYVILQNTAVRVAGAEAWPTVTGSSERRRHWCSRVCRSKHETGEVACASRCTLRVFTRAVTAKQQGHEQGNHNRNRPAGEPRRDSRDADDAAFAAAAAFAASGSGAVSGSGSALSRTRLRMRLSQVSSTFLFLAAAAV